MGEDVLTHFWWLAAAGWVDEVLMGHGTFIIQRASFCLCFFTSWLGSKYSKREQVPHTF